MRGCQGLLSVLSLAWGGEGGRDGNEAVSSVEKRLAEAGLLGANTDNGQPHALAELFARRKSSVGRRSLSNTCKRHLGGSPRLGVMPQGQPGLLAE